MHNCGAVQQPRGGVAHGIADVQHCSALHNKHCIQVSLRLLGFLPAASFFLRLITTMAAANSSNNKMAATVMPIMTPRGTEEDWSDEGGGGEGLEGGEGEVAEGVGGGGDGENVKACEGKCTETDESKARRWLCILLVAIAQSDFRLS